LNVQLQKGAYLLLHVIDSILSSSNEKLQRKTEVFTMANYVKTTVEKENRTELHEKLALTGAEISLNTLPAGAAVPFVHSHKENEEIYGVLSGKGKAVIDSEEISLAAGDWLKISPTAKRQFFAANDSEITYICIQVKENSLEGYTATDAVIY
jgi:mannose-6-phosphate isomerase-like protein (cupin superfamily)